MVDEVSFVQQLMSPAVLHLGIKTLYCTTRTSSQSPIKCKEFMKNSFFFCSEEIHQGPSRKAWLPLSISKTVQSAGEDQTYFGTVGYFCLLGPGRLLKKLLLDMATSLFYFRRISREKHPQENFLLVRHKYSFW